MIFFLRILVCALLLGCQVAQAASIDQQQPVVLPGNWYQADGEIPPASMTMLPVWLAKLHQLKGVNQTGGSYWFYTELRNDTVNSKWVLEPGNRLAEKIDVSIFSQDNSLQRFASGYLAEHEYMLHYGHLVSLPEKSRTAILIRFDSPYYPSTPQIRLYPEKAYHHMVLLENSVAMAALGALISLALYNFFIGSITRDRVLFYYAIYLVDYFVAWLFTFQLPAELFGWHDLHLHYIWFFLLPVVSTLFYTNFLELKSNFPRLAKISRINIILPLVLLPSCFVALPYAHLLATLVISLWIILALICGIASHISGFRPARYFVAAFSALLIPGIIILPANFGLIPQLVRNSELLTLLGGTLDGMLLAFALAYKIRLMSEEKDQTKQQLHIQEKLKKVLELNLLERTEQNERLHKNEEAITLLRDEAIAANLAKSEFIANMSHEIRTPMNSILGMAHLALNTEISDKGRNYLEKIHRSGLHLLGIIEEILDFSKISANKLKLEEVDFELNDLLDSARILFEQRINDKGLTCLCKIGFTQPSCLRGDPLRLGQVLINYVANAIKFTEQGNIEVRIQNLGENENGVLLRFEVQDEGIGIDKAAQSRLFQPFQQADTSTTRLYGGTGLGLSICKQLVELMPEGQLGVESTPGKGSTFWFSVRLKIGSLAQVQESITDLPSKQLLRGLRILVADDHPFNCEVAKDFLELAGAIVCLAHDGQEAFDQLKQQHFDCLLLDIQMPVMDGFEVIRLIRADTALANLPVIAMTASATLAQQNSYLAAGMNDFISKPFDPPVLYATLGKWLNMAQVAEIPAIPDAGSDAIDLAVLSRWIGDDKIKLKKFALNFVNSARLDMKKIDAALVAGDFAALASLAHYVSSPARMVGAIGFADLCRILEAHGKANENAEQLQEIIRQMHNQLDLIDEYIKSQDNPFP